MGNLTDIFLKICAPALYWIYGFPNQSKKPVGDRGGDEAYEKAEGKIFGEGVATKDVDGKKTGKHTHPSAEEITPSKESSPLF